MEQLLTYLPDVLTWSNLLVLVCGSIGGLFFGAMPGLSPTMAVALLVPFTFYMPPVPSLLLLGAVYTSAVAGGSISAILLSIPGAPASIATLLDGYPMAKQGRAQEALYTTFFSSLIGGVVGALALIFLTPPMSEFAMKFGPSELFWTTVFGITVIAGLSSGAMLKGLFGGALGLLLACIGESNVTGEGRFIFHESLTSGIAIVPALIGLFAVPQVVEMMEDSHVIFERVKVQIKEGLLGKVIKKHVHYLRTLTIGSILGTIIGVIPGAGAQVAGLMAYDQVKKMDKNPERFGTGDPEGVCASECANNATVAPACIPLLTLSIPGSPTAAVLLGGLLIQGLLPGPELFTKNADITYPFIIGMFLAQFFMFGFGILASRYTHVVSNVPNYMMFGTVMILCVFGSYCVQNSFDDVLIMFSLGALMLLFKKLGIPSAPIVLGIILGPLAEENFLRGRLIANTDGCLWHMPSSARSALPAGPRPGSPASKRRPPMPREFAAAVVMTLIIAFFAFQLDGPQDEQSLLVPRFLLYLMAACNLGQYVQAFLHHRQKIDAIMTLKGYPLKRVGILCLLTVLYIGVLEIAGFYLSSFVYMIVVSLIAQPMQVTPAGVGKRILVSFACIGFLYLLFTVALTVQIPKGFMPF